MKIFVDGATRAAELDLFLSACTMIAGYGFVSG